METILKWKLETYENLQQFLDEHPEILDDIPETGTESAKLDAGVDEIRIAEGIQSTNTEGVTKNTKQLKKTMAGTIISFARKARPLARNAEKWDLFDQLNYEPSFIYYAPKVDALSRAKNIFNTMKDNSTLFTTVKPDDYPLMLGTIEAYESGHLAPRKAREYKKAMGTEAYSPSYKKCEIAAENIYDYVSGQYEFTNPSLVEQLKEVLSIDREGVQHTGLEAVCIDKNPPQGAITQLLEKVVMTIVELNKSALSDIDGIATLIKFRNGKYHVTFSKAGFKTVEMILKIERGKVLHLNVEMERE
jgi:hypothetical protein